MILDEHTMHDIPSGKLKYPWKITIFNAPTDYISPFWVAMFNSQRVELHWIYTYAYIQKNDTNFAYSSYPWIGHEVWGGSSRLFLQIYMYSQHEKYTRARFTAAKFGSSGCRVASCSLQWRVLAPQPKLKGRIKRREEKGRSKKRKSETVRRKNVRVREKVRQSRNTVFLQYFVAPGGQSRLAKAACAEPAAARSALSQSVESTSWKQVKPWSAWYLCCWFSQFIVIVVVGVVRVFIVDMVVVVAMVALLLPVHAEVVHVTLSLSWSRPGSSWSFYFCCCYCCCSFAVAAVVVVVRLSNKKEGSK